MYPCKAMELDEKTYNNKKKLASAMGLEKYLEEKNRPPYCITFSQVLDLLGGSYKRTKIIQN